MIDDGAEEMWSRSGRRTIWFGEIFFLLGGVILCTAKLSMDGLVAGHIKRFLSFFLSFFHFHPFYFRRGDDQSSWGDECA